MITVRAKQGRRDLAVIRITNLETSKGPYGDYSIEFGVDTANGFAVYQRSIEMFPRTQFNVLGLIRQALNTLEEKELSLDGDIDAPRPPDHGHASRDLARRLGGAL